MSVESQEIVKQFQHLQQEYAQLLQKANDLESDKREHEYANLHLF